MNSILTWFEGPLSQWRGYEWGMHPGGMMGWGYGDMRAARLINKSLKRRRESWPIECNGTDRIQSTDILFEVVSIWFGLGPCARETYPASQFIFL